MAGQEEGPRGGTSTRRRGQVLKTVWIDQEIVEALRSVAFREERTEASIIRDALEQYLEDEIKRLASKR